MRILTAIPYGFGRRDTINTGLNFQFIDQALNEITARRAIGISCSRQSNRARPDVVRSETRCLIAQSHKARNEHRRRREQDHRQRNLSRDKSPAKSMLAGTSANGASALL